MTLNKLILVTILVKNQDQALEFYEDKLGFQKRHDIPTGSHSRWLVVAPPNQKELGIVLRKPHARDNELITQELDKEIGRGTLWTFSTNDCTKTYKELKEKGVSFIQPPSKGDYGVEAIFEDLYGNRFSILEINTD